MSSILKALKKVENDQAGTKPKTLPPLSKIGGTNPRSLPSVKIVFIGLLLFVLGGGTVYYLTSFTAKPRETVSKSISSPKNNSLHTNKKDEPKTNEAIQTVTPQTSKTSKTVQVTKLQVPPRLEKVETTKTSTASKQTTERKAMPSSSTSAVDQPLKQPILEVNGIAYQGENGDSIAVINGVSVSKRSVIEGVTVQDIRQDRVTFSRNGKTFDVELGKTSR